MTGVSDAVLAQLAQRRPDLDPRTLVPTSWDELTTLIRQFVDVGTTKFVVLPMNEPHSPTEWTSHLEEAAQVLRPLET